jgi:hypothetical protein
MTAFARETQVAVQTMLNCIILYSPSIRMKILFLSETPLLRDGYGERGGQRHARGQRSEPLKVVFHDLEPDACIEYKRTKWTVGNGDQTTNRAEGDIVRKLDRFRPLRKIGAVRV